MTTGADDDGSVIFLVCHPQNCWIRQLPRYRWAPQKASTRKPDLRWAHLLSIQRMLTRGFCHLTFDRSLNFSIHVGVGKQKKTR